MPGSAVVTERSVKTWVAGAPVTSSNRKVPPRARESLSVVKVSTFAVLRAEPSKPVVCPAAICRLSTPPLTRTLPAKFGLEVPSTSSPRPYLLKVPVPLN